jgi:hypothetical protein
LIPTRSTGGSPTYRYRLCEQLICYYHCPSKSAPNTLDPSASTFVVDMNSLDLTTTSVEQHMQQQQHKQSNERM